MTPVTIVELGGEKYHVTPAFNGANVIFSAFPVRVKVPETLFLAPEVAAANSSVLPPIISVRLTTCIRSANITVVGLVIVRELKEFPADVTDWVVVPFNMKVDAPALSVPPVRLILPATLIVLLEQESVPEETLRL